VSENEAPYDPAAEQVQAAGEPEPATLVADTMLGQMVKFVIDEIRAAPDVWPKLGEESQDQVIQRVQARSALIIRQAVHLIASEGREVISGDLEQITAKDEIKAVLKLARHDPKRHALLDAVGRRVLIVVVESEQYMGGTMPAPDSNQLPLLGDDAQDDDHLITAEERLSIAMARQ
jgi:hypothetical protein